MQINLSTPTSNLKFLSCEISISVLSHVGEFGPDEHSFSH